jgi:hypothetical protein
LYILSYIEDSKWNVYRKRSDEMPRLVKGGKWTYGWVVVGSEGKITIPPEAWRDFGFRPGGEAIFTPGSHTSGGFAISTPELMADASTRL